MDPNAHITIRGIDLYPPDPIPFMPDGSPDTASIVSAWRSFLNLRHDIETTGDEDAQMAVFALSLYGYDSANGGNDSGRLNGSDSTMGAGGTTITGNDVDANGDISLDKSLGDFGNDVGDVITEDAKATGHVVGQAVGEAAKAAADAAGAKGLTAVIVVLVILIAWKWN